MLGFFIKISNQFVPCDTVLHTGARNSWSKIPTSRLLKRVSAPCR